MTAPAQGDSLCHGGAAATAVFPHSSPSNQLVNKHVGTHSSAWSSEIRDSISFVLSFWQAPTEVNDYTKSRLFFCQNKPSF